jgi:hypothetical protein
LRVFFSGVGRTIGPEATATGEPAACEPAGAPVAATVGAGVPDPPQALITSAIAASRIGSRPRDRANALLSIAFSMRHSLLDVARPGDTLWGVAPAGIQPTAPAGM